MSDDNVHNISSLIDDEEIQEFIEGPDQGAPHEEAPDLPSFHPVLMVWREVLKPIDEARTEPITAGFASKITSAYREVAYADMIDYRDRYFDKLGELRQLLLEEIDTDDQCLTYTTPEEDVEHNSGHYKMLLTDWQRRIVEWEMAWDCTAPDAGVELAAISEVHKFFFGPTGVTAFLDNIRFEFTEQDQRDLVAALDQLKEGQ